MAKTSDLTDRDYELALEILVPEKVRKEYDTQWGTADAVRFLKDRLGSFHGHSGPAPDGPYSDGQNDEYWTFLINKEKGGYRVTVTHAVRKAGKQTILREGLVSWNNLANRLTVALCERRGVMPPFKPNAEFKKLGLSQDDARHYHALARS